MDNNDDTSARDKRTERFIGQAVNIELEDVRERDALRFVSRILLQAAFPHRNPKSNEWTRTNGDLSVHMMAPSDIGLPYGSYPRLIMTWITTEAVRNKKRATGADQRRIVLGRSLSAFMAELGLWPTGANIKRLSNQTERLLSTTVMARHASDDPETGIQKRHIANRVVADDAVLWWDTHKPDQGTLWDSYIELSQPFFDMITEKPVPVDMDVLRAVKQSPLAVDLYCWATYRVSYLRRPTVVPWRGLMLQFGSNYPDTAQGVRDFRKAINTALRKIKCAWPSLTVEPGQSGLLVKPCSPHVTKKPKA